MIHYPCLSWVVDLVDFNTTRPPTNTEAINLVMSADPSNLTAVDVMGGFVQFFAAFCFRYRRRLLWLIQVLDVISWELEDKDLVKI